MESYCTKHNMSEQSAWTVCLPTHSFTQTQALDLHKIFSQFFKVRSQMVWK